MNDDPETDAITTRDEFRAALERALGAAERNDIDVRGSWVYRNGEASLASWEVEIYELE
jgi:hypothetical protein